MRVQSSSNYQGSSLQNLLVITLSQRKTTGLCIIEGTKHDVCNKFKGYLLDPSNQFLRRGPSFKKLCNAPSLKKEKINYKASAFF